MAAKKKSPKKPSIPRRKKNKTTKACATKRPCKASMSDKKYLGDLGRRRAKALAKYRGKRAPSLSAAEAVALGRKRLKALRKYAQ